MKTLYLLRHAKAEPGARDISDPDRTLSPRGREACAAMGGYMKAKAYTADFAYISTSARTRETFERVAQATGGTIRHRFDQALYLAGADEILRLAQEADDSASRLMIVGHNPGMHHVALLLAEPRRAPLRTALELKYPTCALAALRFECRRWREVMPGEGYLDDFITPEEI